MPQGAQRRAAALVVRYSRHAALTGWPLAHRIVVTPRLVTRDDPVRNDIRTIAEPGAQFPAFRASDAATPAWMPNAQ